MKIISMVPSWTETLIECGLNVAGRTRFCIHPREKVTSIPVVGGTKDINWEKVKSLDADILLLDEDENPKWMAEESPIPWTSTHISSLQNLPGELAKLSEKFENPKLVALAKRWTDIIECAFRPQPLRHLPGTIQWIKEPSKNQTNFIYIIWKDPWMAAGAPTFIGSVLTHLGYADNIFTKDKYPKFELNQVSPDTTLLFSSEPYPFQKKGIPTHLPNPMGILDGECFSWFGIRTLHFLEKRLE